jgi:hypothetical protein
MKALLHGTVSAPVIVNVGAWDPFSKAHQDVLASLGARAALHHRTSLTVLLDPPPASFVRGQSHWPVFDSPSVRAHHIRTAGIDAVLEVQFLADDYLLGAVDLIRLVRTYAVVDELWLGATQSLGRGSAGNGTRISELGRSWGFSVHRLPRAGGDDPARSASARRELGIGCPLSAARLLGRPPTWSRPALGTAIPLAWPSGGYLAEVVAHPYLSAAVSIPADLVTVGLTDHPGGRSVLDWPDPGVEYLAFWCGPGDDVADTQTSARLGKVGGS